VKRSDSRILTTHVGSLIRPQELLDRLAAMEEGGPAGPYEESLRRSVNEVVAKQAEVGVDVISDGEMGKASWTQYATRRMKGYEHRVADMRAPIRGRDGERFADFFAQGPPNAGPGNQRMPVCIGPLSYDDTAIKRDIANFKAALAAVKVEEAFLPVVAPGSTAYNGRNEYYKTDEEYVYAIADCLKHEYRAIVDAGILLQVDDAILANMYDYLVDTQGLDYYIKWSELRIEALNHALEGIPEDRVRYHMCFGSWHAPHMSDAPLEHMVDFILKVRAQAYSIEAANVRHEHEWRVWQDHKLPDGKMLIPGVVTHHTITVEHPRLIADRIERYAGIVGRENVLAGTDCGFAQGQATQRVHPSIQWAKLEMLAEGARLATKELWA
jgi:5-methyltetrahydropteroyltriglutamate--homocysteine methyltransferase